MKIYKRGIQTWKQDNERFIQTNKITRMTTSISSEALLPFVAWPTDRRTKYLKNRCSYTSGMCTQKMWALSYIGAEKITFPPKRGWHMDRRQTDICFYRVALLLKRQWKIYPN